MKRTDEKYIRGMDSARAVLYADLEEAQGRYEGAVERVLWGDDEEKMENILIVSRHPAAIEFIRAQRPELANAPVLAQATTEDVRGKHVIGNLPLALCALAESVEVVEFAGAPPRGQEYTIEDMIAAGARLRRYIVNGT